MNEGAERIIRRILAEAEAEAGAIEAEAAQKAAGIEAAAQKEAAGRREQILAQARKEAAEVKRRILGVAALEARKEALAAKQELIAEAFRRSLDTLEKMDRQSYLSVLRGMLLRTVQTGTEKVILSARDRDGIPESFWREINRTLAAAGKKGEFAPAEEAREIRGGFILQSGGVEINCSFEALLEMQRDELEPEVAALLFG